MCCVVCCRVLLLSVALYCSGCGVVCCVCCVCYVVCRVVCLNCVYCGVCVA